MIRLYDINKIWRYEMTKVMEMAVQGGIPLIWF